MLELARDIPALIVSSSSDLPFWWVRSIKKKRRNKIENSFCSVTRCRSSALRNTLAQHIGVLLKSQKYEDRVDTFQEQNRATGHSLPQYYMIASLITFDQSL